MKQRMLVGWPLVTLAFLAPSALLARTSRSHIPAKGFLPRHRELVRLGGGGRVGGGGSPPAASYSSQVCDEGGGFGFFPATWYRLLS